MQALRNALPALRAMGLTSHEAYVRWNLCEPEPGLYDWSLYDAYVQAYREAGVKWGALPDYRFSLQFAGLVLQAARIAGIYLSGTWRGIGCAVLVESGVARTCSEIHTGIL